MQKFNQGFKYLLLITTVLCLSSQLNNLIAQKCSKKKLASKEMRLDYDYRGQSLFKELSNGDETSLEVILYSKQNYRIFVVGEQKLGKIDYQIIVSRKKFNRIVDTVQQKKVTVYKKDPNGFYLYNPQGERIPMGDEMIMDTIWTRETSEIKEVVFDSRVSESFFWEATPHKTQSVIINVSVSDSEKPQAGCVAVYVGREFSNIYQFRR